MLQKRPERRPDAESLLETLSEIDPLRRERARDDTHLLGRKARMVSAPAASVEGGGRDAFEVAIVGDLAPELWLALAANGIVAWAAGDDPIEEPSLVFAPHANVEEVARYCRAGHTVLTDTEAGDIARISALLGAGAAEVVVRPNRRR